MRPHLDQFSQHDTTVCTNKLFIDFSMQEAPCGDFVTHFFCHFCAMCQEYREIRERSQDSNSSSLSMVEVAAPPLQKMDSASSAK